MIGKFVALHRFSCQIFWLKEKHQFFLVFFLSTWLMIFTKKMVCNHDFTPSLTCGPCWSLNENFGEVSS